MSGGIEEQIFSGIEQQTGETFTPIEDDNTGLDTGTDTRQDVQQDQLEGQLRDRGRPGNQDDVSDPLKPRQPTGTKSREEPKKCTRPNPRGDLIDDKGQVVARAGEERRLHTQVQRLRESTNTLQEQNRTLVRQLAETQTLNELPKRFGLSNEDVVSYLELGAAMGVNPTLAARKAIEVALTKGANLKDIVNDEFIPSVTLDATKRLLDERLGPVAERRRQEGVDDQARQEATVKANQFLTDYPDAEIHKDVIAHQMRTIQQDYANRGVRIDPYVAAEQALQRVQRFADDNGLDFTQPLGPQIQARQTTPTPSGANTNPARQARRPMPNGSRGGDIVDRKSQGAQSDDSWGSIVRESMRESGYQL